MNNKILRCLNCGFEMEAEILENFDKCPKCGSVNIRVEVDEELDSEILSNLIEDEAKGQIEQMEDNIKNLGNDRTWELIEQMTDFSIRVTLREYFFNAGGRVPSVNIEV